MLLYHFTAREYLDRIRKAGLTKGDVPLSPAEHPNGVWLTTDKSPSGHGLDDGHVLTDQEREARALVFGYAPPPGAGVPNKRAIRIKVMIPRNDRSLVAWRQWGKKHLDPQWFKTLSKVGGNKDETWFIYFGQIPPDWIVAIDDLEAANAA